MVGWFLYSETKRVGFRAFSRTFGMYQNSKRKGVCGKAWASKQSIIVPNVEDFEGHIACSAASKSEIVIPIMRQEKVIAVLDVDSENLNHFDEIDEMYLSKIVALLA